MLQACNYHVYRLGTTMCNRLLQAEAAPRRGVARFVWLDGERWALRPRFT